MFVVYVCVCNLRAQRVLERTRGIYTMYYLAVVNDDDHHNHNHRIHRKKEEEKEYKKRRGLSKWRRKGSSVITKERLKKRRGYIDRNL